MKANQRLRAQRTFHAHPHIDPPSMRGFRFIHWDAGYVEYERVKGDIHRSYTLRDGGPSHFRVLRLCGKV